MWGLPLALAAAALLSFYGLAPFAIAMKQPMKTRWILIAALIASLLLIVVSQTIPRLGQTLSPAFQWVNLFIFIVALVLGFMLFKQRQQLKTMATRSS